MQPTDINLGAAEEMDRIIQGVVEPPTPEIPQDKPTAETELPFKCDKLS
jgi:hypothetical protein